MIELVWQEEGVTKVHLLSLAGSVTVEALIQGLAPEISLLLAGQEPSRWGNQLQHDSVVNAGDQIAWLSKVTVDPMAARNARVAKQRKDRKNAKYAAQRARNLTKKQI